MPTGWQKKVTVGEILDKTTYNTGKVVYRDDSGHVTISAEGQIIKVIENTREIIKILGR